MIKVGSIWTSSDYKRFTVRGIEHRDTGLWILYGCHGEDRTYECLAPAFLERFKETVA